MYYSSDKVSNRCLVCGGTFAMQRADNGYTTCLPCGDRQAKQERAHWCVAPMNKSNYMLVTDPEVLRQLNPKRTT